jgi:hypothetical protein
MSAVVTFVSLSAVNGKVNPKTVCCVQKVPLISKHSRNTRRRGVQWQAIMSRNNESVAVHTFVTSDWCVMTEQINETGISFGLVHSVLKEDLSTLCDLFVCARTRARERERGVEVLVCACMAAHACVLMEDLMEIRKVSSVELFVGLVQVADFVL